MVFLFPEVLSPQLAYQRMFLCGHNSDGHNEAGFADSGRQGDVDGVAPRVASLPAFSGGIFAVLFAAGPFKQNIRFTAHAVLEPVGGKILLQSLQAFEATQLFGGFDLVGVASGGGSW